ncbi:tetratricopeptide repeat protein [Pseudanabaena sp. FACHB-2040]|uniref:tetratricopeptide repeat protein n=1 Tax=Pseudanabaena sp. FACHB-2040 TaxID=2692859 RepID=UPI001684683E|nr:tetratricopeptide repeat protein [Pseudanabaena sp. FACHB-2040]
MAFVRLFFVALAAVLLGLGLTASPLLSDLPQAASSRSALAASPSAPTPLFSDLGDFHYPISTRSDLAQQYFDQGWVLAYGFNHAEAVRSFQAAIEADPDCALCYFGLAYVLGPNINAPMEIEAAETAWETMQHAIALSPAASAKERALINALATRYTAAPTANRASLDRAYAAALKTVHQQYPEDLEIATLYAEALMDTMPWDYWDEAGNPKPTTREILKTLEAVLEQNPDQIGALHLYIHAVEKERPELAEAAADRLGALVPGSGHLVHMPSHIYIRVGRYHDAVVANQDAIAADAAYLKISPTPSLYTVAYMPHNHHFAWFGAMMTGQRAVAMAAAEQTARVEGELWHAPELAGSLQHYYSVPLYTQVRFSQWNEILKTPAPAAELKYPVGVWHYAQGMALAATDRPRAAADHLRSLQALIADPEIGEMRIWGFNSTRQALSIAEAVLAGEIAAAQGNYDRAVTYLQSAVAQEDELTYTEPPDWYAPTRNLLGQVLLAAGRYADAESAFQADLENYPQNGWSLQGLAQSLRAQNKLSEADSVQAQFEAAWQYADITLPISG